MQPVKLETTCEHLRHKLMYCDARQQSPGLVDDSSDTRVFFCIQTFDALGPDDEPAEPKKCQPGRNCFCNRRPAL